MPKFRKRPIVIEAERLITDEIIKTPEGNMIGRAGDWLVTGIKGEQYPVRHDIFEATYEPVEEAPNAD